MTKADPCERSLARLRAAYVADRLDLEEYEERVADALRTEGHSERPLVNVGYSTEEPAGPVWDYQWRNPEWR